MEAQRKTSGSESQEKELSGERAAAGLDAALESYDFKTFMRQLGEVIKARGGYSAAARAAGLNRTALYKIVSADGNPALNTLVALLTPLGLRLSIKAISDHDATTISNPVNVTESFASADVYAHGSSQPEA